MMLRDMVTRLDSARMSAMFSEAVATADGEGEFLSPRTELTIEDVRRLRLDANDSFGRRPSGRSGRQAPPGLPRPGLKTAPARTPAKVPVIDRKDIFNIDLIRRDTGDAESWLVGSPTASGDKDEISEFFRSRGDNRVKTSISLRSFSADSSDTRSSTPSIELRPKGKGAVSPTPSRLPRTEAGTGGMGQNETIAPSLHQRRHTYAHQKTLSYSVFEEKMNQMGISDQDMLLNNASGAALSLSPSPSASSSTHSGTQDYRSVIGSGAACIRRTLSVTSATTDVTENAGEPSSPRSEIITSQRIPKSDNSVSLFGRKKSLVFGSKGASTRFPLLRRKKSSKEDH